MGKDMGSLGRGRNQLSAGIVYVGDLEVKHGQVAKKIVALCRRTDTTAKRIGSLPVGASITSVKYVGEVDSNAATTATVDVGYAGGNGHELIAAADVKGSGTGEHSTAPPVAALTAEQQVEVTYTETGTGSTAGGPWLIVIEFVSNSTV